MFWTFSIFVFQKIETWLFVQKNEAPRAQKGPKRRAQFLMQLTQLKRNWFYAHAELHCFLHLLLDNETGCPTTVGPLVPPS